MKNIIKSLIVVVAVAAVAGGATYAYFSDTATMSGVTFSTGTMDLKIDDNIASGTQHWVDGFDIFDDGFKMENGFMGTNDRASFAKFLASSGLENLAPGEEHEQIIDIKNVGTINGEATIKFDATPSNTLMAQYLYLTVFYKLETQNENSFTQIASGPLSAWDGTYDLGALNANKVGNVKIVWKISPEANQGMQGQNINLKTTFGLNQVH